MRNLHKLRRVRRRGAVIVLTLVTLTTLLGMAALVVDVGRLYNTRASLQNAADAAALAATMDLGETNYTQAMVTASASVESILAINPIWGSLPATSYEIVFGRTQPSMDGSGFTFIPNATPPNALEVTTHYELQYTFGQLIGFQSSTVNASATAAIGARDVMFIMDVSCTMGTLTNTNEIISDLTALGIPFVDSDSDSDEDGNGDSDDSDDDSDSDSGLVVTAKVTICHYPPSNPANAQTISIASPAVADHLAHGDTMGACVGGFVDCNGNGDSDSD